MKKRKNKNDKIAKEKDNWVKTSLKGLAITFITSIIGALGYNYNYIQEKYAKLYNTTIDAVATYQEFYSVCKIEANPKDKINNQHTILSMLTKLEDSLNSVVLAHRSMGKIESYNTYLKVHEITCWMGSVFDKNIKACETSLLNYHDIVIWRDEVLKQIDLDANSHRGIIAILEDFVILYTTNKENERFERHPCDTKELFDRYNIK